MNNQSQSHVTMACITVESQVLHLLTLTHINSMGATY